MENLIKPKIISDPEMCPHYISCSQNFCPLDSELHLRSGSNQDKCRWMREPKQSKIKGWEFTSGGSVMPDAILKFVPESNLAWLNQSSKTRWEELKKLQLELCKDILKKI
ncbi:MAG: hypothetical protein V1804_00570 [Patescibacteria group bacterium]